MSIVSTNGIRLPYRRGGRDEPVLLVMGSGAVGRVWSMLCTLAGMVAGTEDADREPGAGPVPHHRVPRRALTP